MVFWYWYCLHSLKDCLVTSNDHRQGREGVKQRSMRCFGAVCDNLASKLYDDAPQIGFQRCETWCSFRTRIDKGNKILLNIAGFIVLRIAGGVRNSLANQHISRARRITPQFCQGQLPVKSNVDTVYDRKGSK